MLRIQNLNFAFENKKVLNNLSLDIRDHSIHSIVGLTGAGKTLLLKLLSNLISIQSGTIQGVPAKKSVVFQKQSFFPWLTILKNLQLCTHLSEAELASLMDKFRLTEFSNKYPYQLSGGTLQKVNILRAFIAQAEIIFMDEPFVHLDLVQKDELYSFTLELWQKDKPIIFLISHDLDEALFLSHQVSYLSRKSGNITKTIDVPAKLSKNFGHEKMNGIQQKQYDELYHLLKEELV